MQMHMFVCLRRMGRALAEVEVVQLKHVFPDTSNVTPIVFLLSSGSDPGAMLYKFAQDMQCADRLLTISLGQVSLSPSPLSLSGTHIHIHTHTHTQTHTHKHTRTHTHILAILYKFAQEMQCHAKLLTVFLGQCVAA